MYIVFNQYGHAEYNQQDKPSDLPTGFYALESDINDDTPFAWSDGQAVYQSSEPPPNEYYHLSNGHWVLEQSDEADLLHARKNELITLIAHKADQLNASLLTGYPQTEIDSFYRQEQEALSWRTDKSSKTPMLIQISKIRGVPFDILVQKVLEKSDQFAAVIGEIIGQRQKFEDALIAATTIEQVEQLTKEIAQWSI